MASSITTTTSFIAVLCLLLLHLFANADIVVTQQDFTTRCAQLRYASLNTPDRNPTYIAPIQVFENVDIPQSSLTALLEGLDVDPKADFRIVQLVRIMFLDSSSSSYQQQILPAIERIPHWLRPDDTVRVYWSENHHIMWMSSAWLLQEQFDVNVNDPTLHERLVHYLETKVTYGYYEFFSSLYLPYTLSGLLNLIDFCNDVEIQSLATRAARRLMQEVLYVVTTEGVFYPTAGRNQVSNYLDPYDSNYNSIVFLLTGLGAVQPTTVYHVGAFLTTSTRLVVDGLIWPSEYNDILSIGHDINDPVHNNALSSRADVVLAQWSFGGYFHSAVEDDTIWLLETYNLDTHDEFDEYSALLDIPDVILDLGAAVFDLDKLRASSVLNQVDIAIFKHEACSLTSVQDHFGGHLGFQKVPLMAAVGRLAVWTQSGVSGPVENWSSPPTTNSHLPYVQQRDNVALVMYNVDSTFEWALETIAGIDNTDVSLHWPAGPAGCDDCFVHTEQRGAWFLGQQWGGYIAVRSHCGATVCSEDKQTWAVVVGNKQMYGDWDGFVTAIDNAEHDQGEFGGFFTSKRYYGKIAVDTPTGRIAIEHDWYY